MKILGDAKKFISDSTHNIAQFGNKVFKEALDTKEITRDALYTSQAAQVVYGIAIIVTILSVASAFFSLIGGAPISFLFSMITFLLALDAVFASQKVIEIAKKMFELPLLFAPFTNSEREEIFKNHAINNTLFFRNLLPIEKRYLLVF